MQNNICTQCGYKNNLSANFCKSCGTPLEDIEKSAEQKAEEVKQKLRETANNVKKTSKDSMSTLFILMKPVLKVKVIVPIVVVLLSVVFWDNMVDTYDDYQHAQKIAKEKKAKEERLAKEKKAKEERLAKEKKVKEERLAKEKKKRKNLAKKHALSSYPIGTFYDVTTKLMWQDNKDAKTVYKDWDDSKKYCKSLTIGEYSDWRLPDYNALLSIVDYKKDNPAIKKGFKNVASYLYWSSSEYVSDSSKAWLVYFKDGSTFGYDKSNKSHVRCARGRQ